MPRAWLVLVLGLAGCIDFVAPDLPELGAPAVLQATLRLEDGRSLRLDAVLAPGLDDSGLRRTLAQPHMRLQDAAVAPDSVRPGGARVYAAQLAVSPVADEAIVLQGPRVNGVDAPAPAIRWQVARRSGPDTLRTGPDGEVTLPLVPPAAASMPPPDLHQWVVALTGDGGAAFTIAASGAPPQTIVVPAQFVPASSTGTVQVRFTELLSVQLRAPPGDYVGLITLDNTIRWTVRP